MAISVEIKINGNVIHNCFSENITEQVSDHKYGVCKQTYTFGTITGASINRTDTQIKHCYNDGAILLAIKMLQELERGQ